MPDRDRTRARIGLVGALVLAAWATQGWAQPRETRPVEGLRQPARIAVDRWGVAHIYAASARDAFFVQGYNAARDRLWQIDLWRKRGLGQLARNFGPKYVAQDRAARLLLYRGDMRAEWAAYPDGAEAMALAFTSGINAYVEEVRSGRAPLPVEFRLTDTRPDLWAPDDVVRIRSHTLASNLLAEAARAGAMCAGGPEAAKLMWPLEPAHETIAPDGLDPCTVPMSAVATYVLGTAPVAFDKPSSSVMTLPAPESARPAEGSNAWVIAPRRSTTGRAILANDPHRSLSVPSLRYLVHLEAPGLSVIGAGEPALPGVSLGHNADIAWGLTIFGIDQEDLYVYELAAADPQAYRYGAGWERMTALRETIEVRGAPSQSVELLYTRHGPVLAIDPLHHRAYALRSVWSRPGASAYFASAWLLRARNWNDFKIARDHWGTPPLNLLYADRWGDIGWSGAGLAPIRPNWDGLLPVPGDGRYEWQGFRQGASLPSLFNPARGWIASANEMNLPKGYPNPTAFEWADRSRIARLEAVLGATPKTSLDDVLALQTDTRNPMALRLTRLLPPGSGDARLAEAVDLLRRWSGDEDADSAAAAVYQVWVSQFLPQMVTARLAPRGSAQALGAGSLEVSIRALEAPPPALGPDPAATRDQIILASLAKAVEMLTDRLGPDMRRWRWGDLHRAALEPSVAPLASPQLRARMSVGPVAMGGSGQSPIALAYRPTDGQITTGASVRMALDVGNWDRSRAINMPGQSGDPASEHYADLFPLWARGGSFPLVYSKRAVDAATVWVLHLRPLQRRR